MYLSIITKVSFTKFCVISCLILDASCPDHLRRKKGHFCFTSWVRLIPLILRPQILAPAASTSGERAPGTHWVEGWVGPRAGLDAVEKRKFLTLNWDSNSDPSLVYPVANRYTYCVITSQCHFLHKFYVQYPGTELGSILWEGGNLQPEFVYGSF
jgi:hypothetical protein